MDLTLVFTIIGTGIAVAGVVIGANIALISWIRSDLKSFEGEIRGWKDEIYKEMKDFHGRLCAIEGRKQKTDP